MEEAIPAVCATAAELFEQYVDAQFTAADVRHEARMTGGTRQPFPNVPPAMRILSPGLLWLC